MSARLLGGDVRFLPPVEQISPSLCLLGGLPGVWKYWSTLRQGGVGATWDNSAAEHLLYEYKAMHIFPPCSFPQSFISALGFFLRPGQMGC